MPISRYYLYTYILKKVHIYALPFHSPFPFGKRPSILACSAVFNYRT